MSNDKRITALNDQFVPNRTNEILSSVPGAKIVEESPETGAANETAALYASRVIWDYVAAPGMFPQPHDAPDANGVTQNDYEVPLHPVRSLDDIEKVDLTAPIAKAREEALQRLREQTSCMVHIDDLPFVLREEDLGLDGDELNTMVIPVEGKNRNPTLVKATPRVQTTGISTENISRPTFIRNKLSFLVDTHTPLVDRLINAVKEGSGWINNDVIALLDKLDLMFVCPTRQSRVFLIEYVNSHYLYDYVQSCLITCHGSNLEKPQIPAEDTVANIALNTLNNTPSLSFLKASPIRAVIAGIVKCVLLDMTPKVNLATDEELQCGIEHLVETRKHRATLRTGIYNRSAPTKP